jgi:histone deacetylase 11
VKESVLKLIHSDRYLKSLESSSVVAGITEIPPVAILPQFLVNSQVLIPMQYATGGTVEAGLLAQKHGWAINLGGGFHHACCDSGGGFCVYADMSMAILEVNRLHPTIDRFLIVDLDAHQGNGHENDKRAGRFRDLKIFTMDMFNASIYPQDHTAKQAIDLPVELKPYTADAEYLPLLRQILAEAIEAFQPHYIVYGAGTDCLVGDPLGQLSVSHRGIVERDQIVFSAAAEANVPILMMLSGGYQMNNALVIADSIQNLNSQLDLFTRATAVVSSADQKEQEKATAAPADQTEQEKDQKNKKTTALL